MTYTTLNAGDAVSFAFQQYIPSPSTKNSALGVKHSFYTNAAQKPKGAAKKSKG